MAAPELWFSSFNRSLYTLHFHLMYSAEEAHRVVGILASSLTGTGPASVGLIAKHSRQVIIIAHVLFCGIEDLGKSRWIITTSGFDTAKYLAHHLALLFRINHSNWGWCGDVHFNTNAAVDSPVEGIVVNIEGKLLVFNPAKEPLHKPLHMATKYHLLALRSTLKPLNSCQMH